MIEMFIFFGTIALLLYYIHPIRRQIQVSNQDLSLKVYLSLLFPEIFRSIAIMLYVFDVESELLFLLGLVIVSIQYEALRSVLNATPALTLAVAFILAVLARFLVKMILYKTSDVVLLGGFT